MTTQRHSQAEFLDDHGLTNLLSAEPEKQSIEIALIQRFIQTSKVETARALALADLTPEQRFSAVFARMQSPIFTKVARALERSIPETSGFGRFKGRDY
jgi:hypothetical protein